MRRQKTLEFDVNELIVASRRLFSKYKSHQVRAELYRQSRGRSKQTFSLGCLLAVLSNLNLTEPVNETHN